MGKNNYTHTGEQRLAQCPECPRTIRMKHEEGLSRVTCGGCGTAFDAEPDGTVVDHE